MKSSLFTLNFLLFTGLFILFSLSVSKAQTFKSSADSIIKLENPFSDPGYLKNHLRKTSPRLILTPSVEKELKIKIKTDPVVRNYYEAMKLNAEQILSKPLLTRKVVGLRLLSSSQEMLYRMSILSMVYRIDKRTDILKKINEELLAICNFSDWHPSHFLDVAELSMAVALAVDWTGYALPKTTVIQAKTALIEKGIKPSFTNNKVPGWVSCTYNWNQVCNGGMIAAAIVTAEKDPELAAKTIKRSLDGMPYALKQYLPDGIYPEGPGYWTYGTSFSAVTSSLLYSAFETDFGIASYPGFLKTADFRMLCITNTGRYFNFSDCADIVKDGENGNIVLAWFAKQTGNPLYLEKEKFLKSPASMGKLSRLAGPGLVWLSEFKERTDAKYYISALPQIWKGNGPNPIVIFRGKGGKDDYYFGGKGGSASLSHSNMDAGSFVFDLEGVRWVVDPGTQGYNEIEKTGFDLWGLCQDCQRWNLLTKSNLGHSTLIVDNSRFNVAGFAPLINFRSGEIPEATFDLTQIYKGHLKSEKRKFLKDSDHSITIEDQIILEDTTKSVTWALMTTADVIPTEEGAIFKQEGKQLNMKLFSPKDLQISVIRMDPPPLKLDKKIKDLKRVEFRIPAYLFPDKKFNIKVRLFSPEGPSI